MSLKILVLSKFRGVFLLVNGYGDFTRVYNKIKTNDIVQKVKTRALNEK